MAADQPPAPVQNSTDLLVDVFGGASDPVTSAPVAQAAPTTANNLLDGT